MKKISWLVVLISALLLFSCPNPTNNGGITEEFYTITYFDNAAAELDVPVDTTQYLANESAIILNMTAENTGYDFDGWLIHPDDTYASYQAGDSIYVYKNISLYAKWVPKAYNVNYYKNDGSGEISSYRTYLGESINISDNSFERTGYTFNGWNSQPNGLGTAYTVGDSLTIADYATDLYAQWRVNTYTLSFSSGGGSGSMEGRAIEYGERIIAPECTFTYYGNNFTGWFVWGAGRTGETIQPGDELIVTDENIELGAQWQAGSYTITFDLNGGSGSLPAPIKFTYGDYITFPNPALTKTGYTWEHSWNTKPDRSGDGYGDQRYVYEEDVTLYAVFSPNRYSLIYDRNGGDSGYVSNEYVNFGSSLTVKTCDFSKADSYFTEWNTSSTGNGESYQPGDTFTMSTEGSTLYAIWAADQYDILYNANGGDGSTYSATSGYNESFRLADCPYTRSGYSFSHWSKNADGSGDAYYPHDFHIMNKTGMEFFAIWTPNAYDISFHSNNGANEVATQSAVYMSATNLNVNTFTKKGHDFAGWATNSEGNGTLYADGASFTMTTEGIDLYAQWTPATYKLSFNSNNGEGSMNPVGMLYPAGGTVPANTFTKKGHTFKGWNTQANGLGTSYAVGDAVLNEAKDVELFAQWDANTYQFTFTNSQGFGSDYNIECKFGSSIVLAAPATWTAIGYTFNEWINADASPQVRYKAGDSIVMDEENITLSAQYYATPYTIYLYCNFPGDSATKEIIRSYNEKVSPYRAFSKTGYKLTHYTTAQDGTGTRYEIYDSKLMSAGDLHLYAQWEKQSYTLTYSDGQGDTRAYTHEYESSVQILSNMFTRNGYTFIKWIDSSSSSIEYVAGSTITMPGRNVVIEAVWVANMNTLSFDGNGASSGTMASIDQYTGYNTTLLENRFVRPGYKFLGWNTDKEGNSTAYSDKEYITMPPQDTILYAQWEQLIYSLTFDKMGGIGTVPTFSGYHYGDSVPLNTAVSREGWTFNCWNTMRDGSGSVSYTQNDTYVFGESNKLYAIWNPNSYKVTLDGADYGTFAVNQEINPPNKNDTPTHFFRGYKDADTGQEYKLLISGNLIYVPMSARQVNLITLWEAKELPVTLTFSSNGGTVGIGSISGSPGTIGTIPTPMYTDRKGYTFANFNTESDGSGTTYNPGSSYRFTSSNATLYAIWTPDTQSITFYANNGTSTTATQTGLSNEVILLRANTFTRAGYAFAGWSRNANGDFGVDYTDKGNYTVPIQASSLYAQWKPLNTNIISFDIGSVIYGSYDSFEMVYVPDTGIIPAGVNDDSTFDNRNYDYYGVRMSSTECNYGTWKAVVEWGQANGYTFANSGGTNHTGGDQFLNPVINITYYDAIVWLNALTEWHNATYGTSFETVYKDGLETVRNSTPAHINNLSSFSVAYYANGFRLPTEAEWETAARYQTDSVYSVSGYSNPWYTKGNGVSGAISYMADDCAPYANFAGTATDAKGYKKLRSPNDLGLYDMSGNAWEMVSPLSVITGSVTTKGGSYAEKRSVGIGESESMLLTDLASDCTFRITRSYQYDE